MFPGKKQTTLKLQGNESHDDFKWKTTFNGLLMKNNFKKMLKQTLLSTCQQGKCALYYDVPVSQSFGRKILCHECYLKTSQKLRKFIQFRPVSR